MGGTLTGFISVNALSATLYSTECRFLQFRYTSC